MAKKETYVTARERLFKELPAKFREYEAVTYNRGNVLKYPYLLVEPNHKLTFSAQAVHDESGHSLWVDIRNVSAEEFDAVVRRHYRS